jgi:hypothetical protein
LSRPPFSTVVHHLSRAEGNAIFAPGHRHVVTVEDDADQVGGGIEGEMAGIDNVNLR